VPSAGGKFLILLPRGFVKPYKVPARALVIGEAGWHAEVLVEEVWLFTKMFVALRKDTSLDRLRLFKLRDSCWFPPPSGVFGERVLVRGSELMKESVTSVDALIKRSLSDIHVLKKRDV